MMVPEEFDVKTTEELDLLNLELDDSDFVEFLTEWGSNSPMTDGTVDISFKTEPETTTKSRSDKRKNVMVVSTSDQPQKRFKKSKKQSQSYGDGGENISVLSASSLFRQVTTETAECSAHMAAAVLSKEATLASGALNDREVFHDSPIDIQLSKLPSLLFNYLNSGNIDGIRHIITTYFVEDCLLRTVVMDKAIRGRQHVMAMFEGIMLTHPDFCCIPKSSRVVKELPTVIGGPSLMGKVPGTSSSGESNRLSSNFGSSSGSSNNNSGITTRCNSSDDEKITSTVVISPERIEGIETDTMGLPRCILYKCFFTGTNTFPGECTQYYFNGNLTKYLDDASITDKQLNAMRTLARKVRTTKSAYVSFGRGTGRWVLNDDNKVVEMHLNWRLTKLMPLCGTLTDNLKERRS